MPGLSRCSSEHLGSGQSHGGTGLCSSLLGQVSSITRDWGDPLARSPGGLVTQGLHLSLLREAEVVTKGSLARWGSWYQANAALVWAQHFSHSQKGMSCAVPSWPGQRACPCAPGTWEGSCASQMLLLKLPITQMRSSYKLVIGNFRTLLFSVRQTTFSRVSLFTYRKVNSCRSAFLYA